MIQPNTDDQCAANKSPAASGFRMPAEWEKQSAIWLTWPHDESRWYGQFTGIPEFFAQLVSLVSRYEQVSLIIPVGGRDSIAKLLNTHKAILERICYFEIPTNDVWCRDSGPTFLQSHASGEVGVVDWEYNSWGGKFAPWDLDNAIPREIADRLGLPYWKSPLIVEGGAIEVNGMGKLMTTDQVLLNPNRNPDWTREQVERHFCEFLNVAEVIWLPGGLEGDDTDGHIDNLARFVAPNRVVYVEESDSSDPNYGPLQQNREVLENFSDRKGSKLDLISLLMPEPIWDGDRRLPANYANFLILNGAVIVPTFGQKRDAQALGLLGDLFCGRKVHGLDCRQVLLEGGAVHCLSQQQPARGRRHGED